MEDDVRKGSNPEMTADRDLPMTSADPQPVLIDYVNWRGEQDFRRILPNRILYGSTKWHPEPQWFLEAVDIDKGAVRLFALGDVMGWEAAHDH